MADTDRIETGKTIETDATRKLPFLERLGLHRPELRAWAMYDWANSAVMVTIVGSVFPIYYAQVAAATLDPQTAAFRYGIATTVALALVTVLSPVLGTIADFAPVKKKFLAISVAIGAGATGAMYLIERGDWALALTLFAFSNIGVMASLIFYDSLLPHIARGDELDRVSTAGYAIGFLGGGLLLALNLAWIQSPGTFGLPSTSAGVRLSFLSVAIWWVAFSIPLFRGVPEPPVRLAQAMPLGRAIGASFVELGHTFKELKRFKQAFLMLLAFLIYNDGIQTIIRMASVYATQLGIGSTHLIVAFLLVQFLGIPFTFLYGTLAGRIGVKPSIFLTLVVYTAIATLGYFMTTATHFYLLATLVATVQGGSQALSRSLFASMIPRHKTSEFFGFFSVFEKFAGIFGPLLFSASIAIFGSSQAAILSVIAFFVVGGAVLVFVNVEEGRRIARQEEAAQAVAAATTVPATAT
jgi:MFS transporter, UMF1 family